MPGVSMKLILHFILGQFMWNALGFCVAECMPERSSFIDSISWFFGLIVILTLSSLPIGILKLQGIRICGSFKQLLNGFEKINNTA